MTQDTLPSSSVHGHSTATSRQQVAVHTCHMCTLLLRVCGTNARPPLVIKTVPPCHRAAASVPTSSCRRSTSACRANNHQVPLLSQRSFGPCHQLFHQPVSQSGDQSFSCVSCHEGRRGPCASGCGQGSVHAGPPPACIATGTMNECMHACTKLQATKQAPVRGHRMELA